MSSAQHRTALRRSLAANVVEGAGAEIFGACATGAVVTGWAIHLGGDPVLVGMLSALPIASQVVNLPAAWLTDHTARRRLAVLAVGGSRIVWAPMALLPFLSISDSAARALLFAIVAVSSVLSVIGNNAWTAWMGDLVPARLRGRFFGRRTVWITLAGGLASLATGFFLDGAGDLGDLLAVLSAIAVVAGIATAWLLRVQIDPRTEPPATIGLSAFGAVVRDRQARAYFVYCFAWGAAIAPAASYWSFYTLDVLDLGFSFIAVYGVILAVVRTATAAYWGRAVDRFGARPVLAACSFGIATMPLLWVLASHDRVWPLLLDAMVCGALWGGHAIASMDWPLEIAPRRERPYYLAAFATAAGVGFGAAAGLASGVVAIAPTGDSIFDVLFVSSALLRFCAAFLLLRPASARALAPVRVIRP